MDRGRYLAALALAVAVHDGKDDACFVLVDYITIDHGTVDRLLALI